MKRKFAFLWDCVRGNRKYLYLILLTGMLDIGLALFIVGVTRHLVDVASGVSSGVLWKVLAGLSLCMVFSVLLRGLFSRCTMWLQNRLRNLLVGRFFSLLLRVRWAEMKNKHSGDIMSRMERDTEEVSSLLVVILPQFLLSFLKLCGAFVYLYILDNRLAVVLALLVPVVLLLSKLYFKKMRLFSRLLKEQWSEVCQFFQETMQHREIMKALSAERACDRKLSCLQTGFMHTVNRQNLFSFYSNTVVMLGFTAGYLVTFSWGLYRMESGTLTFGALMAFLQLVNMIQGPSLGLAQLVPGVISSFTSVERLEELETLQVEALEGHCLFKEVEKIEFMQVSFMYETSRPLLDHLNWVFQCGKIYALTGKTGCGKTTVFRLLLAFIKPVGGTIRISADGRSVEAGADTRINFAYVPQNYALVSGSIKDNLKLGKPAATDSEMMIALEQAGADFVFGLPEGLDTRMSEQGEGLSGGQMQRLAIARALLASGKVLLLDEFSSALDEDTEYKVIISLKRRVKDRIILVISHKQAVIDACDCVYRL